MQEAVVQERQAGGAASAVDPAAEFERWQQDQERVRQDSPKPDFARLEALLGLQAEEEDLAHGAGGPTTTFQPAPQQLQPASGDRGASITFSTASGASSVGADSLRTPSSTLRDFRRASSGAAQQPGRLQSSQLDVYRRASDVDPTPPTQPGREVLRQLDDLRCAMHLGPATWSSTKTWTQG